MPKESESLNNKDNSDSKMIAIPPSPQVEEVLISDEEQTEMDPQSYETKLFEKLKDLGLYEDGMTVQQMEELLAVVVASWETAEEEKTRRQFYQDYMTASEAFCNDQIEFTFKDSPECSNHASLLSAGTHYLDIPLPPGSPSAPCHSKDGKSSPLTPNGDLVQTQSIGNDRTSDSSLEIFENEANFAKPSSELLASSDARSKGRRGRSKRGRSGATTLTNMKSSRLFDKQKLTESDGHNISLWKPCLSPKDTPMTCSKRPWLNEPETPCDYTEEEYTQKIFDLVKELDRARIVSLRSVPPDRTLSKPYHLTRKGNFSKKLTKPDKIDLMVGVSAKKPVPDGKATKEPCSRTSGGTFQASRSKENFEAQTTRSGLKYGLYSSSANPSSSEGNSSKTKDSYRTLDGADSPSNLFSEVEVILDEDLPKFNHLRPDIYGDGFSLIGDAADPLNDIQKITDSLKSSSSKAKTHSEEENSKKQNHIGNSSIADDDSSNGSSVIDVETVVDDEIEEFVMKRKLLQEYKCTEKEPNTSQSKRLKKKAL